MNSVNLIGRLTRDPEVRYTASQMAVASFSIAIDRPTKEGEVKRADFPRIVVFGRQAENCEKYLRKGSQVAIEGRIETGSYEKQDGTKVYTTEVVAHRVEFLSRAGETKAEENKKSEQMPPETMPPNFEQIEEDVPF